MSRVRLNDASAPSVALARQRPSLAVVTVGPSLSSPVCCSHLRRRSSESGRQRSPCCVDGRGEGVSTRGIVRKQVERRTRRRQQHGVPSLSQRRCRSHDTLHHPSVGVGDRDDRDIRRVSRKGCRDPVAVDPQQHDSSEPVLGCRGPGRRRSRPWPSRRRSRRHGRTIAARPAPHADWSPWSRRRR